MGNTTASRLHQGVLSVFASCVVAAVALPERLPAQIFSSIERTPFEPATPTTAGLLLIDVDGDGDNDLLAGNPITFFENVGAGHFVEQGTQAGSIAHRRSTVGDMDGDGDLDFCTRTVIYRNVGGGSFVQTQVFYLSLFNDQEPNFLDVDGDGDLDLLFIDTGTHLYLNDGTGFFTAAPAGMLPGGPPDVHEVALLDVERDGDIDLAVLRGSAFVASPQLWRNDGSGSFTEEVLPGGPGFLPFSARYIEAVDFNLDGTDDLIISLGNPAVTKVHINDGTGAFTEAPTTGLPDFGSWPSAGAWGDWDQDGRCELLALLGYWQFDANLDFTFVSWPDRGPLGPSQAGAVIAEDLDGDLDLDLLLNGGPPRVIMNTSAGPVQAVTKALSEAIGQHRLLGSATFEDPGVFSSMIPSTAILTLGTELSLISEVRAPNSSWLDRTFRPLPFVTSLPPPVTDAVLLTMQSYSTNWAEQLAIVSCTANGVYLSYRHGETMNGLTAPLAVGNPTHVAVADLLGSDLVELVLGDPLVDGPVIAESSPAFPEVFAVVPFPTFPPPTPSTAPVRERVIAEDIDGDGDADIVHELRLLRNDGNGVWAVAADFAASVPVASDGMLSIDFDNDGDRDLLLFGPSSPTTLLRNDGSAFVDATFGHIPIVAIAPAAEVTVGDVDADGDEDLLVRRNNGSHLLRNDGGTFTRIADVGPGGRLVDVDRDGRSDLVTDNQILWNVFAHLHAPRLAVPGGDWVLELRSWRQGAWPSLAVLAIGTEVAQTLVPGFGTIYFAPLATDYFPVPLTLGQGSHSLAIPLSTTVLGIPLVAQAVMFDPERGVLTAPVFDQVR